MHDFIVLFAGVWIGVSIATLVALGVHMNMQKREGLIVVAAAAIVFGGVYLVAWWTRPEPPPAAPAVAPEPTPKCNCGCGICPTDACGCHAQGPCSKQCTCGPQPPPFRKDPPVPADTGKWSGVVEATKAPDGEYVPPFLLRLDERPRYYELRHPRIMFAQFVGKRVTVVGRVIFNPDLYTQRLEVGTITVTEHK